MFAVTLRGSLSCDITDLNIPISIISGCFFFPLTLHFFLFPKISITWPDEHTSEYEAEWLKKRCFSEAARAEMQEDLFLPGRNQTHMCPFKHLSNSHGLVLQTLFR